MIRRAILPQTRNPSEPRRRLWTARVALASLALSACVSPPPAELEVTGPIELLGRVERIQPTPEDTLIDLARSHDLGYVEIVAANRGVDPWMPGSGELLLPKAFVLPPEPREGIVINLAEQRLFLFRAGEEPRTFPVGVSRDGWKTPLGSTRVVRKKEGPTWYPGPTARVDYAHLGPAVPPGPDNPLGTHAIYLGWRAILIHGTNEPYGIGRRVSRGCIRLYPEDIVRLFPLVDKGMRVRVINEPVLLGRRGSDLYLEVHPSLAQADELESDGVFTPEAAPEGLRERILSAAGPDQERLDWSLVEWAVEERSGIPVRITRPVEPPRRGWLEALGAWLRAPRLPGAPSASTSPTPDVGEPAAARRPGAGQPTVAETPSTQGGAD